jgi:hypothetical protein
LGNLKIEREDFLIPKDIKGEIHILITSRPRASPPCSPIWYSMLMWKSDKGIAINGNNYQAIAATQTKF